MVALPLVIAFVLLFPFSLSVFSLRQQVVEHFIQSGSNQLALLSSGIKEGTIEDDVKPLLAGGGVLYVQVFNERGQVEFQRGSESDYSLHHRTVEKIYPPADPETTIRKVSLQKFRALEMERNVNHRNLIVGFSLSPVETLLFSQTATLILIALLTVIATVITTAAMGHLVSDPIRKLADEAERMTEEGNTLKPLGFGNRVDEVGALSKRLNSLMAKIREQQTKLSEKRVHEELGKVAAGVAHDMRNSLALLEVAKEQLEQLAKGSEGFQILRDLIHRGSTDLREVAEDLLRKYRGEEKQPKTFFLTEQLDDALNLFRGPGRYPEMTFMVNHGVNGTQLQGDPTLLRRSIANIVKNAVEAMEGKGTITLSTAIEENSAVITIADTGPGMSEETVQKVLQGGYTNGKTNGHGIGTTVVRQTVEEFGGELSIHSELGKGTEFRLRLPVVPSIPLPCSDLPLPTLPLQRGGLPKVLVIDDNTDILLAWTCSKKKLGIGEVTTFESMEACETAKPDYATFDYAFVDKHIDGSLWRIDRTIRYLKTNGVRKVVLASGESAVEMRTDPTCAEADGISSEKIPPSLSSILSL